MTTFKHYTGQQDSTGRLTYTKVNESGEQVFDTLEAYAETFEKFGLSIIM